MKFTLLLFLFFGVSPVSFAVVDFTPSQQIMMTAPSCAELNFHGQTIADWANIVGGVNAKLPECYCSSTSCQMDVAPISPYLVKDLTNFKSGFSTDSAFNGPNCFNAALAFSGTLPRITFTHPFEMSVILESSLCREIPLQENLRPGDVMVVRNQNDPMINIHAAIYLNPTLSFSKYGENSLMPYAYGLDADKVYGVREESCRRVFGTPRASDVCHNKPYVNFFSCKPLYTYISELVNQPMGIDESVRIIYANTSRMDLKISDIAHKGAKVNTTELAGYQKNLIDLYAQTEAVKAAGSVNAKNGELNNIMRAHIFSLYEQTRRIARGLGFKELTNTELPRP